MARAVRLDEGGGRQVRGDRLDRKAPGTPYFSEEAAPRFDVRAQEPNSAFGEGPFSSASWTHAGVHGVAGSEPTRAMDMGEKDRRRARFRKNALKMIRERYAGLAKKQ